jgi:pimeloyl-ACP methyl ester carboxylesterase
LSFQSFACDVETLLAALHVGDFYLLANASSAWFGIAVAARLGARVRRLMLTSPRLSPPRPQKGRPGMANYFFSNLRRHPWLLDSTLFILRAKLSRPFMRSLVFHFFEKSPVDFAMLERNPVLVEDMLDSTIESVGAGYRGLMQEGQLIIEGNFPDISAVVSPVVVWYGEQDGIMSPAEILDGLARHGLVTEELTGFPDVGHYLYENRQRELLERLIR